MVNLNLNILSITLNVNGLLDTPKICKVRERKQNPTTCCLWKKQLKNKSEKLKYKKDTPCKH